MALHLTIAANRANKQKRRMGAFYKSVLQGLRITGRDVQSTYRNYLSKEGLRVGRGTTDSVLEG